MDENLAPEIPLTVQLCSTLNFFASGSHQRRVGQDAFAMLSQSCVSRCISSISKTIATKMMDKYIVFPQTIEEIKKLCDEFQEIADFPDTGYPLEPWLLTTYNTPKTVAEKEFNVRLRSLRSLVERAIGLLKARFRCLLEGKLRYDPEKCGYIIYSCAVLHNFFLDKNYAVDDLVPVYHVPDDIDPPVINNKSNYVRGAKVRNSMAQYFTQN